MNEVHGLVTGSVQGVGFRAAARRTAMQYHLKGFVRNLEDGRVEFLVQGSKPDIETFLATIKHFHVELTWQVPKKLFPTFEIVL